MTIYLLKTIIFRQGINRIKVAAILHSLNWIIVINARQWIF